MPGLKKKYIKEDLTVIWQPDLCIHSTKCFQGLPEVFNPSNRPWVNLDASSIEKIKNQVNICPSGALSQLNKGEINSIHNDNGILEANVTDNGPILIKGPVVVTYNGKQELIESKTIAFCRCGSSDNKPFCDGSHKKINFKG